MQRRRKIVEREPLNNIEFVRLIIFYFRGIDANHERNSDPMRSFPRMFSNYGVCRKLFEDLSDTAVFFPYFFQDIFFERQAEFEFTSSAVPSSLLVTALFASFVEQKASCSVGAVECRCYASIIYADFHNFIFE